MNQTLVLSDNDFKATIFKLIQQIIKHVFGTSKKWEMSANTLFIKLNQIEIKNKKYNNLKAHWKRSKVIRQ